MVYVFLAEGFEECEALTPVDILRRGGIEVALVGVGAKTVTGSHGITVVCDITTSNVNTADMQAVVLPGGMPGTLNLDNSSDVHKFIDFAAANSLPLCAICAAPSILGKKGLLNGKKATCFNGFEKFLSGAEISDLPVIKSDNIITACGAGAAAEFGFTILTALTGDADAARELKRNMKF